MGGMETASQREKLTMRRCPLCSLTAAAESGLSLTQEVSQEVKGAQARDEGLATSTHAAFQERCTSRTLPDRFDFPVSDSSRYG